MSAFRSGRLLTEAISVAPLVVSFVSVVILSVAAFGIYMGFPLGYFLIAYVIWVLSNYFFEIVEFKAAGNSQWPVLSIETIASWRNQMGAVFGCMIVLLAAMYWGLVWLNWPQVASLFGSFIVLTLPGVCAVLAVTRNPLRAINPASLFRFGIISGFDYVIVLLVTAGVGALWVFASGRQGFVDLFAASYSSLLLAYVIGAVVYDKRIALGVRAPSSPEARHAAEQDRRIQEWRSVLDQAYSMAVRGGVRAALNHLTKYLELQDDPLAAGIWMFDQMTGWEDSWPALEFGATLAAKLEASDRQVEAAKIRLRCQALDSAS